MHRLRIVGDVHGQITQDEVARRNARCYLDLIEDAAYSVQIGDMGDGETYALLKELVDPSHHVFFPGNHDHYNCLPEHSLGDWGLVELGGVEAFFIRGALSSDRQKLIRLGKELGKTLWHEVEELSDEAMANAEEAYQAEAPEIVLSHEAPEVIARAVHDYKSQRYWSNPDFRFESSRTQRFLTRLLVHHKPKIWLFGHHHLDWQTVQEGVRFVCVGELSTIDIDAEGNLLDTK